MWFSPDSIWNKKLPPDVPTDPNSAEIVKELVRRAETGGRYGIGYKIWTTTLWLAKQSDPLLKWQFDGKPGSISPVLEGAFGAVPTPLAARPSGPWELPNQGDNHIVIYADWLDTMWEAWKASQYEVDGMHPLPDPTAKPPVKGQAYAPESIRKLPGWHWEYGAVMDHVSTNKGIFDNDAYLGKYGSGWHATATGLPLVGGTITHDEGIAAGEGVVGAIPHALTFAAPQPLYYEPRWPAIDSDGSSHAENAPGEGMIFKLPASFDPATIKENFMREVCRAVQRFGMILRDGAASVSFYCESRATEPGSQNNEVTDIWLGPGNEKGKPGPEGVFKGFASVIAETLPWDQLEVVHASYRPTAPVPTRLIIGT